jgi:hypothetical protein
MDSDWFLAFSKERFKSEDISRAVENTAIHAQVGLATGVGPNQRTERTTKSFKEMAVWGTEGTFSVRKRWI